jgi:hypothetical protein
MPIIAVGQASFTLTGYTMIFGFLITIVKGAFTLIGQTLTLSGPAWTKQSKNTSVFTDETKH